MKKMRMCFPREKTFADGFAEYIKARSLRDETIHHYQASIKQIYKRISPCTPIFLLNLQNMIDFYIALRDDPNLNEVSMGTCGWRSGDALLGRVYRDSPGCRATSRPAWRNDRPVSAPCFFFWFSSRTRLSISYRLSFHFSSAAICAHPLWFSVSIAYQKERKKGGLNR